MFLAKSKDKLILQAPVDSKEMIKAIGSYKWNKMFQLWEFPLKKVTAIMDNLKVEITPEVEELYKVYKGIENERKRKIDYVNSLSTQNWDNRYPGLWRHQKITLEAARQFDSYALFLEPGLGKTLVVQELFLIKKASRALVICPLNTINNVWKKEVKKWHPELKFCNLWEDVDLLESENADIYAINYEQFKKFYDREPDTIREKIASLKTLQRKTPGKFMDFERKIESLKRVKPKELKDKIDFLVIDESSKLKDNQSQITEAAIFYKDRIPYRFVMSGTPAPNSTLEFWGQMCFINSDLLGDNFYRFRNKYFASHGYGGHQYSISIANRESIMQKIKEQAIFFAKKDELDLPEQIFEERYIEMDEEQTKVYKQMLTENIAYFKDKVVISPVELVKIMKLREITSGFFFDDQGAAITVSERKIDFLMEILEEIGNHQVAIFCNFDWEIDTIKDRLKEKAVVLRGKMKQKDKDNNIEMFMDDVIQYFIANVKSSAHGQNFQNCHYAIYFSLSYSHEDHRQSQDRFHRGGQKNKVTYFYTMAKDTIDDGVLYKVLTQKADILDACMEMLKRGI